MVYPKIQKVSLLFMSYLALGGILLPVTNVYAESFSKDNNQDDIPSSIESSYPTVSFSTAEQTRNILIQTVETAKKYTDRSKYQAIYVAFLERVIPNGERWIEWTGWTDDDSEAVYKDINAITNALNDVKAHPQVPGEKEPSNGVVIIFSEVNGINLPEVIPGVTLSGNIGEAWKYDLPKQIKDSDGGTWNLKQASSSSIIAKNGEGTEGFDLDINQSATGVFSEDYQFVYLLYTKGTKPEEPTNTEDRSPVYRVYNPNNGEHLYTLSQEEAQGLIIAGWKDEGTGWSAGKTTGKATYRLYNPNSGEHFYTQNEAEYKSVANAGWKKENVAFYGSNETNTPIFRVFNPNARDAGSHHYTMNQSERDGLVNGGWKNEGTAFYGK